MILRNPVAAVLCLLLSASAALAQVSGRLSGTVTDPTDQVVVAAEVTVTNAGTSEQRVDRWGGGDSPRANIVANPIISNKCFDRWFNAESVAGPGFGDLGNAPRDVFRGPGLNCWGITVFK